MSVNEGKKHKSGIPLAKTSVREGSGDSTSRSQTSQHGQKDPPHQTQLSKHPLSKAMEKKPKAKKAQSSVETWADEEITSQSQKLQTSSQSDHRRRKEDMEKQLKEAEKQLSSLTGLLEKREKLMKEAQEEADKKTAELEQKVMDKDGLLIEHGIDPVTGEKAVLDEQGQKKLESTKKFTKKRIQEMREKLRQMNEKTETYLSDIENTVQYLDSLEVASLRAGPLSEETQKLFGEIGSEEDIIAQVYKENQQPASRFSPAGKESPVPDHTNDDDADDDDGDKEEGKDSQFFLTHAEEEDENDNNNNVDAKSTSEPQTDPGSVAPMMEFP